MRRTLILCLLFFVSFAATTGIARGIQTMSARRVMEKVGMTYDPSGDFCHPDLPNEHVLSPHVLYRKLNPLL